jgi:pimeloyl-ACP methyl ester carboxylesterase
MQAELNGKKVVYSKSKGDSGTVVFISGFASPYSNWQKVFNILDTNIEVFCYNRPGIGGSENVDGVRDAITIANELKQILELTNTKPPYIFVAHSMGGIYARTFHSLNPGKLKGLVLVDATHENRLDSLIKTFVPVSEQNALYAALNHQNDSILNTMPPGSLKEEFRANFQTNYNQIRYLVPKFDIPTYVIASTQPSPSEPVPVMNIHRVLQKQWANSAGSKGYFIETVKSGHFIQLQQPELIKNGVNWILKK